KETFSTIGEQRANNYALQPMTKAQFIAAVTDGIQPAPAYFFKDAKLNKQGYATFDDVLSKALKPLTVAELEAELKNGTTIIDTRIPDVFELGFITGSLNFGLNGQYAIWAATILDITTPVVLVAEPGKEQESAERLTRVGFDNIKGFLQGGFEAWLDAEKRYDMVISIDDEEFELDVKHTEVGVLDVRKPGEFNELHVDKAQHFSLDKIVENTKTLDPTKEYLVHCAGGYRSMIAVSYLKAHGIKNVKNVWGGFGKIKERGGLNYVSTLAKAN
ncbi:MAG: rhodanese-like domain-containing protein, partial [Bacteroidia bacterium]